jgi:hypothetical protein
MMTRHDHDFLSPVLFILPHKRDVFIGKRVIKSVIDLFVVIF